MRIAGSRILITGAGSGIGAATARRCASLGAEVIAVDIDGDAAQRTADDCGAPAGAYTCDVAEAQAVGRLAERVESERGPVDVLVNNAGVGVAGPFLDNSLDDYRWLRGVNLDGVTYGCHIFGTRMVRRGHGHVVNVASGAGYFPQRNLATYCSAKAGVVMLSRCLRAEWAFSGVGVSAICPGVINTPIASHTRMVGSMVQKREKAIRALRLGHSPDLVAKAIVGAIEHNRAVVPVGIESAFAYRVLRHAPDPVRGFITRRAVI